MTAPSPIPKTGTIDGRYELTQLIAKGSMGTVYKGRQLKLDRTVAIKVLDIDSRAVDADDVAAHHKRFLYEAATLSRLSHVNTVRVFDYGIWNGDPYLVMEFIEGQSLEELLKGSSMEPLRALRIARQVCASLGEAHGRGLVHRDLKPANLLVMRKDDRDMVKVVDFGLVKEVGDAVTMTGDGMILGTPLYMSPEQIRGVSVDQRCDVYAMGVLMYRMIIGRPPFHETQTAALLMAHLSAAPASFEVARPDLQLPACIEWTVLRCLEKDREDRFATVDEVERALKVCEAALLQPDIVSSMTMSIKAGQFRVAPVVQRSPWVRAVPVILGVCALALLFSFVVARGVGAARRLSEGGATPAVSVDSRGPGGNTEPPSLPPPATRTVEPVIEAPVVPERADGGGLPERVRASELADPAVAPRSTPRAVARPRPVSRPRPAPPPRPAARPQPALPEPAAAEPSPAPASAPSETPEPAPSTVDVKQSDLRNPFGP